MQRIQYNLEMALYKTKFKMSFIIQISLKWEDLQDIWFKVPSAWFYSYTDDNRSVVFFSLQHYDLCVMETRTFWGNSYTQLCTIQNKGYGLHHLCTIQNKCEMGLQLAMAQHWLALSWYQCWASGESCKCAFTACLGQCIVGPGLGCLDRTLSEVVVLLV